jgi:hypothetical protein
VSYSTFATASISLALVAVAVSVAAVVLQRARRPRWASRAFSLVLVVFGAAAASAFFAACEGDRNLQAQTHRVLALAASAERTALARSGRFTTSIARLQRLRPALADEIRVDGASVQAQTDAITRSIVLHASLGFGTTAMLMLDSRDRASGLVVRRAERSPPPDRRVT